uniref:Uncharacterized protein n=1 Tax=viral metagenome TaxID=1070528 RepID=A0A6M3KVT8_9ZZZZ
MFRKGHGYNSLEEFLEYFHELPGARYIYYNNKLMHMNFFTAMSLNSIERAISQGIIYHAEHTS